MPMSYTPQTLIFLKGQAPALSNTLCMRKQLNTILSTLIRELSLMKSNTAYYANKLINYNLNDFNYKNHKIYTLKAFKNPSSSSSSNRASSSPACSRSSNLSTIIIEQTSKSCQSREPKLFTKFTYLLQHHHNEFDGIFLLHHFHQRITP